MNNRLNFSLFILILGAITLSGQTKISGFIFETGNRGYISQATVTLSNEAETEYYGQLTTDESGAYEFTVSGPGTYLLSVSKKPYFDHQEKIVIDASQGKTVYLKHALKRNPGYIFEITIAEKDPIPDASNDALKGALVEVYNNTKREEIMVIEDLQSPEFKVDLLKGNHYTLLIRKDGFLSKRMEAFVDVEGCILCFEGIGNVTPGVSDNLTEANSMGVLLANVEMDRYFEGKVIGLNDIYYDFGKSNITKEAAEELHKVAAFLKDNPSLKVELGSHTDSRGGASANMSLSEKRARSAVDFLVNKGGISKTKITGKGYGETNLTNKCADGVQCSDEEHRLNRRTVLKVLDVINEGMQRRLRQMKAEEFMDEILADLDNAGQIKVKEGQTIDEAIAEKGSIKTSIISDPNEMKLSSPEVSPVVEVTNAVETRIEETEVTNQTPPQPELIPEETVANNIVAKIENTQIEKQIPEDAPAVIDESIELEEDDLDSNVAIVSDADVVTPEADQSIVPSATIVTSKMDEQIEITKESDSEIEIPKAEDISNKVDLAVGEGNTIAEEVPPAELPKPRTTTAVKDVVVETRVTTPPVEVPNSNNVNTAVEEWIRPGASKYSQKTTVTENTQNRYSPNYNGYKVVVIFSRFELPKEHQVFSMHDDVDIYTTADSNKLYMVGAFETKKQAYAHMNSKLKKPYPHSYVVGFENGIRIY